MPVNRYELPAQQQVANTYVDLPYKELLLAGQAQQADYDKIEASRNEWANKQWNNLSPDDERAKAKQAWLESENSKIADLYTKDYRQARQAFKTFERDAVKEFGKFGSIGAMEANYNAFQAQMQKEEERLKKAGVSADMIRATKQYHLAEYAKQGGIGDDASKYQNISLEDLADYQSYSEFMNTYGKDIEAELSKYGTVSYGQDGQVIVKKTGSTETVDTKTVQDVLRGFAQGDDKLLHYLNQGVKMGYTSGKGMETAFNAAVEKYDYTRKERDTDWDVNGNWGRMMDEKAKYGDVITGTNATDTGATPKTNWLGMPVANNYQEEVKNKEQQLNSFDSKIAHFNQILNSNATATSKASADKAIKNLEYQKLQLEAELNTDTQIINSITESAFKNIFPNSKTSHNPDIDVLISNIQKNERLSKEHTHRMHGTNQINARRAEFKAVADKQKQDLAILLGEKDSNAAYSKALNYKSETDNNIQSYHENKVTYTPTLQIVDGKNPEATKIKDHVVGNPNQYNFKKLVNGKMVDYNPNASTVASGWLSPNAKTTTELVNIVADGKNTSQYVVKDASGKVIETYYASPKDPESVTAVYNNYYDKVGANGLMFKESTNNPVLYNDLLKKTNQLTNTIMSSSTQKDITSNIPLGNDLEAQITVDGATPGDYNLKLFDKKGKEVLMQLPDGTVNNFTTVDFSNLFLILNDYSKQP